MFILLTYDVVGDTKEDKKRLHKVAKVCEKYGIRVQDSVFELVVDAKQMVALKNDINNVICNRDSVRLYKMYKNYEKNIEVLGCKNKIEISNDNSIIL